MGETITIIWNKVQFHFTPCFQGGEQHGLVSLIRGNEQEAQKDVYRGSLLCDSQNLTGQEAEMRELQGTALPKETRDKVVSQWRNPNVFETAPN